MKIPTQYIFTWQLILSSSSLNTQFAQLSHELSILPLYFNLFTQLLQACNYEDREHRDITMLTLPALGRNMLHVHHIFLLLRDTTLGFTWLKQTTVLEIVLDNDICDGIKHKLYVVGICRAREMRVDFLCVFPLVQIFELQLNVGRCLFKVIVTCQE